MPWTATPPRPPHRCYAIRQGTPEHGPYFDVGLDYFRPIVREDGKLGVNPALLRLYLSAEAIVDFCGQKDSPLVAVSREDHDLFQEMAAQTHAELQAANDRVADLEVELSELKEKLAAWGDPEALAKLVAEKIKPTASRRKAA